MRSQPARWCRIAARALTYARTHAIATGDPDRAQRLALLATRASEEAELYPDQTHRPKPDSSKTIGWYLAHDPHIRAVRRTIGLPVTYAAPETPEDTPTHDD